MERYDLIVRNGSVVLPDGVKKVDVGIKDGIIAAIAANPG